MAQRRLKPDLTGPDETLDELLARLRASDPLSWRPQVVEYWITSPRPRRPSGLGAAEAPIPADPPPPDLCGRT